MFLKLYVIKCEAKNTIDCVNVLRVLSLSGAVKLESPDRKILPGLYAAQIMLRQKGPDKMRLLQRDTHNM